MTAAKRMVWIDNWKGLLILLVVAGHYFGAISHASSGVSFTVSDLIYKVIYFFHMPAFFFLTGICWNRKDDHFLSFVRNKARRLLVPYFVFGILSCIILIISKPLVTSIGGATTDGYYASHVIGAYWQPFASLLHGGGWPCGRGFICNSVLWFLPAMFSTCAIYWLLDRRVPDRRWQCAISVIFLICYFWFQRLPAIPFGLSLVPKYLPFVIMGRWLPRPEIENYKIHPLGIVIMWIVYAMVAYLCPDMRRGYWVLGWHLLFTVITFAGIYLSIATACCFQNKILIAFGASSLGIMLTHKFLVLLAQVLVAPRVACHFGLMMATACVIIIVITGCCLAMSRIIVRVAPWSLGERSPR